MKTAPEVEVVTAEINIIIYTKELNLKFSLRLHIAFMMTYCSMFNVAELYANANYVVRWMLWQVTSPRLLVKTSPNHTIR